MLLRAGKAAEAEKLFRADLQHFPRNGRSLFGLAESLKAQGNTDSAKLIEMQFKDSWKLADTKLSVQNLELGSGAAAASKASKAGMQ
jgi:thioredoxin-like negative regulator of GroEL